MSRKAEPINAAIKLLRRAKKYVHACEVMMDDLEARRFRKEIVTFLREQGLQKDRQSNRKLFPSENISKSRDQFAK